MRYGILVLFLSAGLCAQTPPALAANQQADKPPVVVELERPDAVQPGGSGQSRHDWLGVTAAPGKSAPPVPHWWFLPSRQPAKPPSAKWQLFLFPKFQAPRRTASYLLPNAEGVQPPLVQRTAPGKTLVIEQRAKPCAVPLTNVLRAFGEPPKVRRIPIPNAHDPMTEVPLPAPSCDDRK
jgi:hypothetical protein